MLGLGLGLTSPAVIGGGAVAAPPWTPLDLGAKLVAWWNAGDTVNGAVATWTDRVSSIATTATAGLEPISAATSFNGAYRGLTFDGTDDCLVATSFAALPSGATAGEIWAIANNTAAGASTGGKAIIRYGSGAASATNRGLQRNSVTSVNRAQGTDGITNLTDTAIDFSGPHILGGWWSGTTEFGRIDGRDFSPASTTIATLATTAGRLRLGAFNLTSASGFWQGIISDIFVTTALTGTEREKLEGWGAWNKELTARLPSGHPYKSAAP